VLASFVRSAPDCTSLPTFINGDFLCASGRGRSAGEGAKGDNVAIAFDSRDDHAPAQLKVRQLCSCITDTYKLII
jgi:hypothetical protein